MVNPVDVRTALSNFEPFPVKVTPCAGDRNDYAIVNAEGKCVAILPSRHRSSALAASLNGADELLRLMYEIGHFWQMTQEGHPAGKMELDDAMKRLVKKLNLG